MTSHKQQVQELLGAFQASLFAHLISVAERGKDSDSHLGWLPFPLELPPIQVPSPFTTESKEEVKSLQEDVPEGEAEFEIYSERNDIYSLECTVKGRLREESVPEEFEISFEEDYRTKLYSRERLSVWEKDRDPSGLREELRESLRDKESSKEGFAISLKEGALRDSFREGLSSFSKEGLSLRDRLKESQPIGIDESFNEGTRNLYGEAIVQTYSQGGDGFALHPGDIVTILHFLHEYGMVECRWQGLQGLFPADTIKVMTTQADSLSSSLHKLAVSNLFSRKTHRK